MAAQSPILDTLKSRWLEIQHQYQAHISNNEVALVFRIIMDAIALQEKTSQYPEQVKDYLYTLQRQFPAPVAPLYQDLLKSVLQSQPRSNGSDRLL